jgi:hypothetical protein
MVENVIRVIISCVPTREFKNTAESNMGGRTIGKEEVRSPTDDGLDYR